MIDVTNNDDDQWEIDDDPTECSGVFPHTRAGDNHLASPRPVSDATPRSRSSPDGYCLQTNANVGEVAMPVRAWVLIILLLVLLLTGGTSVRR